MFCSVLSCPVPSHYELFRLRTMLFYLVPSCYVVISCMSRPIIDRFISVQSHSILSHQVPSCLTLSPVPSRPVPSHPTTPLRSLVCVVDDVDWRSVVHLQLWAGRFPEHLGGRSPAPRTTRRAALLLLFGLLTASRHLLGRKQEATGKTQQAPSVVTQL